MGQITNKIMMIRPANFAYNAETAENNSFQTKAKPGDAKKIKELAIEEFDAMVKTLESNGIEVIVIQDTDIPSKPDAVFPNNWISAHGGIVVTYPMFAANRRIERREDIVEKLLDSMKSEKRYSFEYFEDDDMFLEGTGSMILDRVNKIVYACLSPRTDIRILDKFCVLTGYKGIAFHSFDKGGELIYHTNVMMGLGVDFVVICLDCIKDEKEQKILKKEFLRTGKKIIEITEEQVEQFAGNMLQVLSRDGESHLVMSDAAYNSLTKEQIEEFSVLTNILSIPIPTIEKYGGGSVRCMMAEVFD